MNIKTLFRKGVDGKQQEEQAPTPITDKKKKRRRKWIILGVILLLIVALLVNCSMQAKKMASMFSLSNTAVLKRADIQSTVGATGTVESANSHTVYSTQSYPVKTLNVEVGDVVQEGDLLCELDASALEDQIEAQELATGISAKAAAQQVKTARDSYNATKKALDEGLNPSLISSESAVQNAYDAWQKAIRTYDQYTDNDSAALIKAQSEYDIAKNNYDIAKAAVDAASPSSLELNTALENAERSLEAAEDVLDAAYDSEKETGKEYKRAIESAYNAYITAQQQFEAAQQTAQTQLQSSKNALSSAEINGNTDSAVLKLAQMQEDLDETHITANASGTVTAVYAKVGANGAGLLFVIEDIDNLIVKTSVSGYDIGSVKVGMPTTIKSDATGETVINGKINTIAPTSEKNAQGQTNTAGDVLFDTEVAVLDKNTGLRIGMSARIKYIVDQQSGVIAVPFDALYEKEDGQSYVIAAIPQSNGKFLLKEIAVTKGLENDLDVVITGDGIEEGLRILTTPGNYRALVGREVTAFSEQQEQALQRFGVNAARS